MNGKIILTSIITTVLMAVCFGFSNGKQENGYEMIEKTERDITYPQINFLNEKDTEKEEKINALIRKDLYGPYRFMSDSELATSITYEVTYNDKEYLSICYTGAYVDESGYAGSVGYAITIDLKNETIVKLEDIIGDEGKTEIVKKIENGEFETEYGVMTPDSQYIDVHSILQSQSIVNPNISEGQYYYFLREQEIGIIIIGLPRYGGNYSIICVEHLWKV